MAYEIFSRKHTRVGTPQISFMVNGRVAFNKAATRLLIEQAVENVLLMWDPAARRVALRPIAKKDPRAYKVHVGKRDNNAGFSAISFLEHIGVGFKKASTSVPLTWNAEQGIFEASVADVPQRVEDRPLLASVGNRKRE